ncbi:MAG: UDP-3-O-(3-hydroxymyristoyl)glucosamine N-acyltransferase [Aphanocapsa sp. GSE-SYN-MK-11-07L]|jgi:UDP-3-O-[3-hydroxymyristoyl] glucosamine N-acyltransferase|nr:UDP-3-O-(3-hydroxymyristoyl)glucosamine N-acyltransferase [Aphanocapsa sp. GSE-SYN-MK-11-07L]
MQLQELAQLVQAQVESECSLEITGVATIDEAEPGDVTFLSNPKYIAKLPTCRAGAIFVADNFDTKLAMPTLRVKNPYLAFAQAIELFHHKPQLARTVHPTAVLGEGVSLGQNVAIAAYVVIGNHVQIGDDVTIHPHCAIYDQAVIGAGSTLHSHVVIREQVRLGARVIVQNGAIVGADGYGFVPLADGSFYKILQAGTVILEDDVEVQANSAIDRATVGATEIGRGTKIDNLVQIGHGSKVGQNSLLCGQVGLAGSTQVGNQVILAGQVGIAGHLTLGDRVVVAAQSGITKSLPAGSQVAGYPAIDHKLWLRTSAEFKNLATLSQRLRSLEKKLASLSSSFTNPADST